MSVTYRVLATNFFVIMLANPLFGGDWPMWRRDALRSASAPDEVLADTLHLQ
jgi:hypothetical protein